jgi:hypothetical protein
MNDGDEPMSTITRQPSILSPTGKQRQAWVLERQGQSFYIQEAAGGLLVFRKKQVNGLGWYRVRGSHYQTIIAAFERLRQNRPDAD